MPDEPEAEPSVDQLSSELERLVLGRPGSSADPGPSSPKARPPAPAGKGRARWYAVARCCGGDHLLGIHHAEWASLRDKLPRGGLYPGETYIRGFDSEEAATTWLASEVERQCARLGPRR